MIQKPNRTECCGQKGRSFVFARGPLLRYSSGRRRKRLGERDEKIDSPGSSIRPVVCVRGSCGGEREHTRVNNAGLCLCVERDEHEPSESLASERAASLATSCRPVRMLCSISGRLSSSCRRKARKSSFCRACSSGVERYSRFRAETGNKKTITFNISVGQQLKRKLLESDRIAYLLLD